MLGYNPFAPIEAILNSLFSGCGAILVIMAIVIGVVILARISEVPEEEIIERWSCLLPDMAAWREHYLGYAEQALTPSGLSFSRKDLSIVGDPRASSDHKYVRCKYDRTYSCFYGAVVIGPHIHLNWALREKDRLTWLLRIPLIGPPLYRLLVYRRFTERNQARAFGAVTHSCAIAAAERILDEANLDKSKLNRKTSGQLGPL